MNDIELRTSKLVLRPFGGNDLAAVQAYAGDAEILRYMLWGPNDEAQTRWFLDNVAEKNAAENRTHYDFAVCLASTGALIGGCGIYREDEQEAQMGWLLNKAFWKRGYGTELAAELIRFGFEDLGLHRIYSTCDADNYGSYRVMERNNMRREGCMKQKRNAKDGWKDELHYAILRCEWEALSE